MREKNNHNMKPGTLLYREKTIVLDVFAGIKLFKWFIKTNFQKHIICKLSNVIQI